MNNHLEKVHTTCSIRCPTRLKAILSLLRSISRPLDLLTSRTFLPLAGLQLDWLPRLPLSQLHLHQVQRRGGLPEEPLQPTDLQRRGFPLVCQLHHRLGAVHAGGGLCLLLLGLHQTKWHSHLSPECQLHTITQVRSWAVHWLKVCKNKSVRPSQKWPNKGLPVFSKVSRSVSLSSGNSTDVMTFYPTEGYASFCSFYPHVMRGRSRPAYNSLWNGAWSFCTLQVPCGFFGIRRFDPDPGADSQDDSGVHWP